jgi:hypothetical protein
MPPLQTFLCQLEAIEIPNPGYGAAINAGLACLKASASEYVLFATQDAAASMVRSSG